MVKDLVKELSARQSIDILDYYKETVKEGTRSNELQEQAKQMGFTGTSSKLEKALARQQQAANAALNESQKQISDLEAMKKRMKTENTNTQMSENEIISLIGNEIDAKPEMEAKHLQNMVQEVSQKLEETSAHGVGPHEMLSLFKTPHN